jgi:hypothetical protein
VGRPGDPLGDQSQESELARRSHQPTVSGTCDTVDSIPGELPGTAPHIRG